MKTLTWQQESRLEAINWELTCLFESQDHVRDPETLAAITQRIAALQDEEDAVRSDAGARA